jgi:hypothetical protein
VILVDSHGLRVASQRPLPAGSNVIAVEAARDSAVLLLGPEGGVGPAQLAVVDADEVRVVPLQEIEAGATFVDPAAPPPFARSFHPGLAVDAARSRAFVVPGAGPVAEIRLADLAVEYHAVANSVGRRLADGGPGIAVPSEGAYRQASWIGHGLLAVSGEDNRTDEQPEGFVQTSAPAGLRLLDTRTWTARTLDDESVSFTRAGGLLVGVSFDPTRFAVYDADGRPLARRSLPGANGLQLAADRAYVTLGNEYRRHRVRIFDLRTGNRLGTVWVPGWFFPLSRSSPQLCWC